MKFHSVDMRGDLIDQRVTNLPPWTSDDEGRLLFVTSEQTFYYGANSSSKGKSGWVPLYVFKNIAVATQSTVVADDAEDTLTLVAGNNTTITTVAGGDSITIGLNSATNALISDLNNFLTSGRKLWIYENVAPTGWTIVSGTEDGLLAVKRTTTGSAYYVPGGSALQGTWTLAGHTHSVSTVADHLHATADHTLTIDEMPSHQHYMGRVCGSTGPLQFVAGLGLADYYPYTDATGGGLAHNHGNTTSAGSHNHTLGAASDISTWRPLANVGIIVQKD
jgi:hypothetical protein